MNRFHGVTDDEYNQLKEAVALITILIAGADGHIDAKEKEWAEKVTKIRSYTLPLGLKDFYQEVGEGFSDQLSDYAQKYEGDVEKRNQLISDELRKLNTIFPKIEDREVATALYESYLSFAGHVAKASGGFLSWGKINTHEKQLLNLDMIKPVED